MMCVWCSKGMKDRARFGGGSETISRKTFASNVTRSSLSPTIKMVARPQLVTHLFEGVLRVGGGWFGGGGGITYLSDSPFVFPLLPATGFQAFVLFFFATVPRPTARFSSLHFTTRESQTPKSLLRLPSTVFCENNSIRVAQPSARTLYGIMSKEYKNDKTMVRRQKAAFSCETDSRIRN